MVKADGSSFTCGTSRWRRNHFLTSCPVALTSFSSKPGAWTEASAASGFAGWAAGTSGVWPPRAPPLRATHGSWWPLRVCAPVPQPLPTSQLFGKATGVLSPPHPRVPSPAAVASGVSPSAGVPLPPRPLCRVPGPPGSAPLGAADTSPQAFGVAVGPDKAEASGKPRVARRPGLVRQCRVRRDGRALTWAPGPGARIRRGLCRPGGRP